MTALLLQTLPVSTGPRSHTLKTESAARTTVTEDDLADRLAAVERRLDAAYPEPQDGIDPERVEAVAERVADVEAAVEAIEGYVGEIQREDCELERRADAALAATDGLEGRVEELEARVATATERATSAGASGDDAPDGDQGNDTPAAGQRRAPHAAEADVAFGTPSAGTFATAGGDHEPAAGAEQTPPHSPDDRRDDGGWSDVGCDDVGRSDAGRNDAGRSDGVRDGRAVEDRDYEARTDAQPVGRAAAGPPPSDAAGATRASGQQARARRMPGDSDRPRRGRDRAPTGGEGGASGSDGGTVSGWGADSPEAAASDPPDRRPSSGSRERSAANGATAGEWGASARNADGDEPGQTLLERLRELL